jgi:hydrogenase expression/formation protein HypE
VSAHGPDDVVLLAHGSGGALSHALVERQLLSHIWNATLAKLDDSAVLTCHGRIAFTTDSYIVSPLVFPGGDIGRLAVCGTVNDLAMVGAQPMSLSLALIIEEGLPFTTLDVVMRSVRIACDEAGVEVVTGDTKVVNRGKADGLFITTAGIGAIPEGIDVSGSRAQPGDRVLISGGIAEHGVAIMSAREGLSFSTPTMSDCAPLNSLVRAMSEVCAAELHCMRDPTRGGVASTLNEIAAQSGVSIIIDETALPVQPEVRSACEMLGLDPLYVANEGKLIAIVAPARAAGVLQVMREHPLGRNAADIGEVLSGKPGRVMMRTRMGPTRLIQMLAGELLPRIC